jgi:entericidin B
MKKLIGIIVLITMIALTGCNTMHGVGEDVEQGGEAIQKSTK